MVRRSPAARIFSRSRISRGRWAVMATVSSWVFLALATPPDVRIGAGLYVRGMVSARAAGACSCRPPCARRRYGASSSLAPAHRRSRSASVWQPAFWPPGIVRRGGPAVSRVWRGQRISAGQGRGLTVATAAGALSLALGAPRAEFPLALPPGAAARTPRGWGWLSAVLSA